MPGKPVYNLPFKSYSQLTTLLQQRGMAGDAALIQKRLEDVGYQRLQAYWSTTSQGRICADIDTVWTQYCFDRQVRLLLLDAIERIEVAVRNRLVHYFCEAYGPYGYLKPGNFPSIANQNTRQGATRPGRASNRQDKLRNDYKKWRKKLYHAAQASTLLLLRDYKAKYFDKRFPLWHTCEVMDFGSVVRFYGFTEQAIQKKVSRSLGLPSPSILSSWLRALNDVRNACAHHNRVWNRSWVNGASIPANQPDWYAVYDTVSCQWQPAPSVGTVAFSMQKTGGMLTVCQYLIKQVASSSQWRNRVFALFAESRFCGIPQTWMGLPRDWQNHPIWHP